MQAWVLVIYFLVNGHYERHIHRDNLKKASCDSEAGVLEGFNRGQPKIIVREPVKDT